MNSPGVKEEDLVVSLLELIKDTRDLLEALEEDLQKSSDWIEAIKSLRFIGANLFSVARINHDS